MNDKWKSLAERLGAPSFSPPPKKPTDNSAKASPQPESPTHGQAINTVSTASAGRVGGSATSGATAATEKKEFDIRSQQPKSEQPVAESPKPKKRSWGDMLSSLLNIPQSEAEPVQADEQAGQSSEACDASAGKPLFGTSGSQHSENPALEEMFGTSGNQPHPSYWEKPKRVVDDLGWDTEESDEAVVQERSSEDEDISSLRFSSDSQTSNEDSSETQRRPRRRRRRGGRKDRSGDETRQPSQETDSSVLQPDFQADQERDPFVELSVYDEQPSILRDQESDDDFPVAERRSSRRRRRRGGRDRDREQTSGEVRLQAAADSFDLLDSRPVDGRLASGKSTDDDYDSETDPDSESLLDDASRKQRSDSEDRADSGGRERRKRRRGRGGQRKIEADLEPVPEAGSYGTFGDEDDAGEAMDQQTLGEDDHEGGHRHRSIPTWEDSIAVLVESNLENHRRNENRGSRGNRPKGRR